MSIPCRTRSSDSFYAKWKGDLLQRATTDVPPSPRHGVAGRVARPSMPPQCPTAHHSVLPAAPQPSRPHSARAACSTDPGTARNRRASNNAAASRNYTAPVKCFQPQRPSTARLPLGQQVLSVAAGRAQPRDGHAATELARSAPVARPQGDTHGRSRCDLLVEVDRIASSGRLCASYEQLHLLADDGALPKCCVHHALLAARVTLVVKGPVDALRLYQRISPGCIPCGEVNAAQTVQRMSESSGAQWLAHADAVVDAFQRPAPSVAAAFLLMKATRLVALHRMDEALSAANVAARMCPASCDAATLCGVLRYAMDERSAWWAMDAPIAGAGVSCRERLHHNCVVLGGLLSILQHSTMEARELPSDRRRIAIDRMSCAVEQEVGMPAAIAARLRVKLNHARVEASLEAGDAASAVELVALLRNDACPTQRELWCWLTLRCLASDGRLGDAFEHCCQCGDSGAVGQAVATGWKRYVASHFVKKVMPAEYYAVPPGRPSCHEDIAPYEALGFASWEAVHALSRSGLQKRYRRLCLVLHPDKWMGHEKMGNLARYCFQWMTNAYQALLAEL